MKPTGLEHHTRDFAVLKVPHELISLHQELFPELKDKMRYNPNAVNQYGMFLILLAAAQRTTITPELKKRIEEAFTR